MSVQLGEVASLQSELGTISLYYGSHAYLNPE